MQAARCCRCPPAAPGATVWDTCATAESAPRDVEHSISSKIDKPDIYNCGRGLAGVRPCLSRPP
ncbi:unnamed protein product [Ectocarpus sp. 12 AP-2014]